MQLGNTKNEQLIKTVSQLSPQTDSGYLDAGVRQLNEYELWMKREERLGGTWAVHPFVNYIKYRHHPVAPRRRSSPRTPEGKAEPSTTASALGRA